MMVCKELGLLYLMCLVAVMVPGSMSWSEQWDFFTYAQAWPPGTCASAKEEHHMCHVPDEINTWAVHGLWPSSFDKEPAGCNNSWQFDFSKVAILSHNLSIYWPNLYNDTKYDSFWEHEWDKHGTCCTDLPATSGELNYFTMGLHLNQKYNISSMLSDAGIVPSVTAQYSYDQFIDAIKNSTGFEPVIECAVQELDDGSTFHLIDQIEICLNKDFTPRTCYQETYAEEIRGRYSVFETNKGDKSSAGKMEEDTLYFKSEMKLKMRRDPQSNCPQKYSFNYPPIKHF